MSERESRLHGPEERMFAFEWLDPETGVLSLQDLEGDGSDWPSPETVSEWVGAPVKVFGSGNSSKYPELIYVREDS